MHITLDIVSKSLMVNSAKTAQVTFPSKVRERLRVDRTGALHCHNEDPLSKQGTRSAHTCYSARHFRLADEYGADLPLASARPQH
ncbi:hypothetical protein, partial [Streptomyces cadmiisoli]|uniref:hypothetical protein n=1 Tax=Streptomyces cadmiisoli TaxID=2184053 RepID=UPI003D73A82E